VAVIDIEPYLQAVDMPPATVEEFWLRQAPVPGSLDRYYVTMWEPNRTDIENRFFHGVEGYVSVWDAEGPVGGGHYVAQNIVRRGLSSLNGEAVPTQSIEAGVHKALWQGDSKPHFIVFFNTNGYSEFGDNKMSFNRVFEGWVQHSQTKFPGAEITPASEIGDPREVFLRTVYFEGNWWVNIQGEYIGYYPGSIFAEEFLRSRAASVGWFGEVLVDTAKQPTSTDMGSGLFAIEGWTRTGHFRNAAFYLEDQLNLSIAMPVANFFPTDEKCYSKDGPFVSDDDPAFRSWGFFGGPGKEGPDCKASE
jgi:hypothetical protein